MQMSGSLFFFCRGANRKDGHFEVQVLASHWVVEVELNAVFRKRGSDTLKDMPGGIAQAHRLTKVNLKISGE